MINALFFILLILYATSITYPIPGIFIFFITIIFFAIQYRKAKIRTKSKTTALIQLMCYSVPLSWKNILGGDYGDLPITWFYLIGVLLAIHLLLIKKDIILKSSLARLVVLIVLIMIYSLVPLLITNTNYLMQGISQFITLTFHHVIILIVILKGNIISESNIFQIEKSYVSAGLITSLGIITQFMLFNAGVVIGDIQYLNNRQMFQFLFSDVSHATLYLATTAFLSIQLLNSGQTNGKFKSLLVPIIILIGAAVTSARTGLIVFFGVFALYILIGQKGIVKKIGSIITGIIALIGGIFIFQQVRPQDDISEALFDSSGRTEGYKIAIDMFMDKPFLGYGFGREYISDLMNAAIPHLSFLQYLIHAGFGYTVMIFIVIGFAFFYAKKFKMNESWLILLTLIGTCLIPDIFSTRYITLLIVIVFLRKTFTVSKKVPILS